MNDFYRTAVRLNVVQSRVFFASNPEWWIWLLSISIWGILIFDASSLSHFANAGQATNLVLCLPGGQSGGEAFSGSILKQETVWTSFYQSLVSGILPWIMMIFAMMFPLLKRSIRHVAFSVQKRNREYGVSLFLVGYTLIWSFIGILFHFVPILTESIADYYHFSLNFNLLAGFFFFLAAIVSWLPNRRVTLMKCDLTLPIRLHGWYFLKDSVTYGMKIGVICMQMCWIVMIGLMLVHHSIFVMLAASFILVTERYLVPHNSKLIGYFWMLLGALVLILGVIN